MATMACEGINGSLMANFKPNVLVELSKEWCDEYEQGEIPIQQQTQKRTKQRKRWMLPSNWVYVTTVDGSWKEGKAGIGL